MPGTLIVDDNFTGLALDATLEGRAPPITNSSYTYRVDPNTVMGDGNNDVKFLGGGRAAKLRTISIDGAVQVTIKTNSGNETFGLFSRDYQSTPYPRDGYIVDFKPNSIGGNNGVFSITVSTNFTRTYLSGFQDVPWTYSSNNIDVVALESIGTSHRVIINNAVAATFTNSAYNASTNNRCGVVYHSSGNPSVMRMDRFSVLDSVVISSQPLVYTIVRVS